MTVLRALKKLLLGETWSLPLGLALALLTCVLARSFLSTAWEDIGGFVLLAAVAVALVLSVAWNARGY